MGHKPVRSIVALWCDNKAVEMDLTGLLLSGPCSLIHAAIDWLDKASEGL